MNSVIPVSSCQVTPTTFLQYLSTRPKCWGYIDFRENGNRPISGTYYRLRDDGRYDVFHLIYRIYSTEVIYRTITYICSLETMLNEFTSSPNYLSLTVSRLDLFTAAKILHANSTPLPEICEFVKRRFNIICRMRMGYYSLFAQYVYLVISEMVMGVSEAPRTMKIRRYLPSYLPFVRPIIERRNTLFTKFQNFYGTT